MTTLLLMLAAAGSALGIWYALLGIRAIRHLRDPSHLDRVVGWSLWWCIEMSRYDEEGQRLCRQGQRAALGALAVWVVFYLILA